MRATYNEHPYPTPEVVERLSRTLGVGTKTISNWFHNHRMRAKLNPAAPAGARGAPASGKRPAEAVTGGVVMTSFDDASSYSDRSASPGDFTTSRCRSPSADVSAPAQWLFPSYDSMTSRATSGCDVTPRNEEQSCEAEDLSVRPTSCASASMTSSSKSSSRRKSSKPQWVFEGTQLDKSRVTLTSSDARQEENGGSDDVSRVDVKLEASVKNNNQGETSDADSPTSAGEDDVSRRTDASDVTDNVEVDQEAVTSQRSSKKRRFGVVDDSCQLSARNSPSFAAPATAVVDVS